MSETDEAVEIFTGQEVPERFRKGVKQNMPQMIEDYGSYDVPKGDSNFLKLEDGDTRLRLCSKPLEIRFHQISGENEKYATTFCAGDKCELCKQGNKLKYKYAFLVLNRGDKKPYIYESPISVFRQITAYARNTEYGDPEKYDLTISRSGKLPNISYSVVASPKVSDLTADEVKLIAESGVNLETAYSSKE